MPSLSALYCVHNEEHLIEKSIRLILPYVDEVIYVDNGSTDKSMEIVRAINNPKIKIYQYEKTQVTDMGAVRSFSLSKATGDWFIQIDADEYYPAESMEKIRRAIEQPGQAISFRVAYYNLSWKQGYAENHFEHYPDRIYRRDVVEKYGGVLPVDMTYVKREHLLAPNKEKGTVGILEYDNMDDRSFEHPKQPILKDVFFYHLARTRGYNYEYNKWRKYMDNIHPTKTEAEREAMARGNSWVNGNYAMQPIEVPEYVPTKNIPDPKLSVIITNYNYGQYVGRAIESVLNQTRKPYEIIVIDDASTDNSVDIIKKYPVTLMQNDHNMKVALTRNKAIGASTGDYYMLLDADDALDPRYIEIMLPLMENAQVAYSDLKFMDKENEHHYPDWSKAGMLAWQIIPSVCAIVDRHVFEIAGGFNHNFIYEDWGFWLELSNMQLTWAHCAYPLFHYRVHSDSLCYQNDKKQAEGFNQLREKYGITRQPDQ